MGGKVGRDQITKGHGCLGKELGLCLKSNGNHQEPLRRKDLTWRWRRRVVASCGEGQKKPHSGTLLTVLMAYLTWD